MKAEDVLIGMAIFLLIVLVIATICMMAATMVVMLG